MTADVVVPSAFTFVRTWTRYEPVCAPEMLQIVTHLRNHVWTGPLDPSERYLAFKSPTNPGKFWRHAVISMLSESVKGVLSGA